MKKEAEIIWIYGSSAAGKETFIKKIIAGDLQNVLTKFEWNLKDIVPCLESIKWIAVSDTDPIREKREAIIDIVPRLIKNGNEIVLIKGQDLDLEKNRIVHLQRKLPNLKHRVIFLDLPLDEIFKRAQEKVWWEKSDSKEVMGNWLKYQVDMLLKIPKEIEVNALDSSEYGNYKEVTFPPKL